MKKILIIGANKLTLPIIKMCKQMGCKVVITDKNENCMGRKYADEFFCANGLDKQKILEIAKKTRVVGIITQGEDRLPTLSYVCEKLNLPGLSQETAKISRNKYLLREYMKKNNLRVPEYKCVHNEEELRLVINTWTKYPAVVKPTDLAGGIAVIKVNNSQELREAFEEARIHSELNEVIIEEYLEGQEYSVETLTQNNETHVISITEKTVSGYPYFIEIRHVVPAQLSEVDKKAISELVINLFRAIKANNCAGHTELKLTKDGPIIIETGARAGGDFITSDLVPLATGVDMWKNIIKIAIGEQIEISECKKIYAGIQYIMHNEYEKFLGNYNMLKENENVLKIEKLHDINKKVEIKCNPDRLGYYMMVASTKEELEEGLNVVCK